MARRTSRWWRWLASTAGLACCLVSPAQAQQGLLLADPRPLSSMARSNGPIPLVWQLNYQGSGLLKGHLDVSLTDGNEVLARVRVSDLVLTSGQSQIVTMLPPVAASNLVNTMSLRARFTQDGGRIDLGDFQLRAPGSWQHSLVACICAPDLRASTAAQTALTESVRLEQFYPPMADKSRLVTSRAMVLPSEMPDDPLFYCGFDIVVLTPEGFADLQAGQLEAIEYWVAAGGSLLVIPGRTLEPEHAEFLNKLFRTTQDDLPFVLDSQGRLVASDTAEITSEMELRTARVGIGRAAAALTPSPDALEFDSPDWRSMLAFLWKVRRQQLSAVMRSGAWDVQQMLAPATSENQDQQPYNQYYGHLTEEQQVDQILFGYEPLQTLDQLLRQLMPQSVRVVSGWLIAGVLLLYIVVIGPGDYWLLGLINRRKWTWVLFPAVTIAFTLFAMWLSHLYMGTTDLNKTAVFLDVGDDGRIVRENRLELVFAGTRRQVDTELRRGMFTPINHLAFGSGSYGYNQNQDSLVGAASYAGRMPFLYQANQDVPQWTPQINRVLHLAPEVEPPKVDWNALDVFSAHIPQKRDALVQRLEQAFGNGVMIRLYHGEKVEQLARADAFFSRDYTVYNRYTGQQVTTDFIRDTCVRTAAGLLAPLSQISPTGGPSFEDLPLLDSTDERQRLLVVVVPRADELLIYRKLYVQSAGDDSQPPPQPRTPVEAPQPLADYQEIP